MAVTVEAVKAALQGLIDPNTQKDYVAGKSAKRVSFISRFEASALARLR